MEECPHGDDPATCKSGRHVLAEVGVYVRPDTGTRRCRGCMAEVERARPKRRRTAEQNRTRHLRITYKMTPEEFARMLAEQGGVCAICKAPPPEGQNLHIDHDHGCCPGHKSCGRCVRGLLCTPCNRRVGLVESDVLGPAIAYIEERARALST